MNEYRQGALTDEELDAQHAQLLPDREELSVINPNAPLPWDPRGLSPAPPGDPDPTPVVDPGGPKPV